MFVLSTVIYNIVETLRICFRDKNTEYLNKAQITQLFNCLIYIISHRYKLFSNGEVLSAFKLLMNSLNNSLERMELFISNSNSSLAGYRESVGLHLSRLEILVDTAAGKVNAHTLA
jgi:hypothetical protein